MELKQNANRCAVLLHEIYGINQHIKYYAEQLFNGNFDVYVPNLLNKEMPFSYEEEETAYRNFIDNIGFEKARKQVVALINELSKKYKEIHVIGFSIGATIAWLCSDQKEVHKVVGFYGSRIRQFTDIVPEAEVLLVFGEHEKSFNPRDLQRNFSHYSNVLVKIVDGEHGFADPYSPKYNEETMKKLIIHF